MNVSGPASTFTPSATSSVRPPVARANADPGAAANPTRAAESNATARSGQTESLWDLLTPEERDFFTRAATMGPLTYRPTGKTHLGDVAPTGQRIDVRG